MNTTTYQRTLKMVQLALFTAIILLMAFTPIGYIRIPGLALSITLLVVPVTVGAIILGPVSGAILGGVFGITSFIQCFGMDPFGSTLLSINPIGTFVVTMLPRILMGWLSGIIFISIKKIDRTKSVSYAVTSLAGPLLNTVLFMSTLILIFYRTEFIQGIASGMGTNNVFAFVSVFVGINGLVEAAICFILGTAISKAVDVFAKKSGI